MEQYTTIIVLSVFILGFLTERYILPILDLKLQMFTNRKQLEATKTQIQIDNINRKDKVEGVNDELAYTEKYEEVNKILARIEKPNIHAIGFDYKPEEYPEFNEDGYEDIDDDDDDDDEYEDCDCDECKELDKKIDMLYDKENYEEYKLDKSKRIGFDFDYKKH